MTNSNELHRVLMWHRETAIKALIDKISKPDVVLQIRRRVVGYTAATVKVACK